VGKAMPGAIVRVASAAVVVAVVFGEPATTAVGEAGLQGRGPGRRSSAGAPGVHRRDHEHPSRCW